MFETTHKKKEDCVSDSRLRCCTWNRQTNYSYLVL